MKKSIIFLGNPLLRLVSQEINKEEFGSLELKQLERDLFDTMIAEQGLGLAAPQMGINKRAIVFGLEKMAHTPEIPYTILFNPSFETLSDEMVEDYEGCLSIGELRGKVKRHQFIRYRVTMRTVF